MKILFAQKNPVIEIYTNKGLKVLLVKKIVYIKSSKKGSIICLSNTQKIETGYILKSYSTILPITNFFRCHNSYIVNCKFVDCYCGNQINLINNIKIPLFRRRKDQFKENLIKYERGI